RQRGRDPGRRSDDFYTGGESESPPPVPAGKLAGSKFLPDTAKDQGSEVFVTIDGSRRSIIVPTDPGGMTGYPDSVIDDPADYTIPNGPAVAFDRDAATAWLTETVLVGGVETVRADEFGI